MDIQSILSSIAAPAEQLQLLKSGEGLKGRVLSKTPEGQYLVQIEGNGIIKVASEQPLEPGKLYSINIRAGGSANEVVFTLVNEGSARQAETETGLPILESGKSMAGRLPPATEAARFLQAEIMKIVQEADDLVLRLTGKTPTKASAQSVFTQAQPGKVQDMDPVSGLTRATRQLAQALEQHTQSLPPKTEAKAALLHEQLRSTRQALSILLKQSPDAQIAEAEKELGRALKILGPIAGRPAGTPVSAALRPGSLEARLPSLQIAPGSVSASAKPLPENSIVSGWVTESQPSKTTIATHAGKIDVAGPIRPPLGSWVMATIQTKMPATLPMEPYTTGEIQREIAPHLREPIAQWKLPDTSQNRAAALFLLGQKGFVSKPDLESLSSALAIPRTNSQSPILQTASMPANGLSATVPLRTPIEAPSLDAVWAAVSVLHKTGAAPRPQTIATLIELARTIPQTEKDQTPAPSLQTIIKLLEKILSKPENLPFVFATKARELLAALRQQIAPWPHGQETDVAAEQIKQHVENSGLFYESKLARAAADPKQAFTTTGDIKGILMELVRILDQNASANAADTSLLRQEAGRMLSRTEQQQIFPSQSGEQFVVPFTLDGKYVPVNLVFRRQGRAMKQPGARMVSVHCETTQIGRIRADIRMSGKRVRLILACENEAAAPLFAKESEDLGRRLLEFGISLERFSVKSLHADGQENLDIANRIDIII